MTETRKKILFIFLLINISVLIFTLFFCIAFEPEKLIKEGAESTCIFQKTLGFYCPGCGGTRSVGYLLSLDIINSFLYYPPLFVGIFLIIWIEILLILSFKKDSFYLIKKHKYFEFLLIPVSILLTFLIRNILLFHGVDFIGDFIK